MVGLYCASGQLPRSASFGAPYGTKFGHFSDGAVVGSTVRTKFLDVRVGKVRTFSEEFGIFGPNL